MNTPHQKDRNCSMTREVILVCLHDCVIQRSRRKIYVIYETPYPMQRRVEYIIIMYMKSSSPSHLCDSGTKGVSDNLDETVDGHLYSLDPALRCLNGRSRTSVHNGVTAIRLRRRAQDDGNHHRGHSFPSAWIVPIKVVGKKHGNERTIRGVPEQFGVSLAVDLNGDANPPCH